MTGPGPIWGVADTGMRHAFRPTCGACSSEAQHRRTHKPHAYCGKAWAPDWPVVDFPGGKGKTCGSCQRITAEATS